MTTKMPHRVIEKLTGMASGAASVLLLNINWINTLSDAAVKVGVTVFVGMAGGIAGLMGKDIYNAYLKKYFKPKNDE